MKLLSIDPGNVQSAWILFTDGEITEFGITPNTDMPDHFDGLEHVAIEYMRPRGNATAQEEFDTQFWAGRFVQALCGDDVIPWTPVSRMQVKMHVCGKPTVKDAHIRRALIDDWYGGDATAIGNKKCRKCKGKGTYKRDVCGVCGGSKWLHPPGPLVGIHDDLWSALAIGITWLETKQPHVAVTITEIEQ